MESIWYLMHNLFLYGTQWLLFINWLAPVVKRIANFIIKIGMNYLTCLALIHAIIDLLHSYICSYQFRVGLTAAATSKALQVKEVYK